MVRTESYSSGLLAYGAEEQTDGESELKFEELAEQYYRPLFQFALSLTRCDADAADLVQHTFFTWKTKGGQLRDTAKVKSWLFTTMHRAFLQRQRREQRFPHYELETVAIELPSVDPAEHSRLDCARVLEALGQIDETFRAPVALFYLEDYCYKEIARMLGVPLGTVKSRIARGIGRLQEILEPLKRNETKPHHPTPAKTVPHPARGGASAAFASPILRVVPCRG